MTPDDDAPDGVSLLPILVIDRLALEVAGPLRAAAERALDEPAGPRDGARAC